MKNFLFLAGILFVVVSGCAVLEASRNGGGEVFEGTGQGYRGPIHVQVRLDDGVITEIIVESAEDRFVGEAAIEELIEQVIECNSTDVDVVSGATESSRGFLEAVDNAIMQKRTDEE